MVAAKRQDQPPPAKRLQRNSAARITGSYTEEGEEGEEGEASDDIHAEDESQSESGSSKEVACSVYRTVLTLFPT